MSATPHTVLYRSFWNFAHVFSMVWKCAYGLDIILELIFVTFSTLSFSDLRLYESGYLVSATPYIISYLSLCNFEKQVSHMWFACGLDIVLALIFVTFFHFVIFWPQILWNFIDSGYLVSATLHTILYQSFWNFAHVFFMVWKCAYGLDIILELIFVTFSTLSFSDLRLYESGYLVSATPYIISYLSLYNFEKQVSHIILFCFVLYIESLRNLGCQAIIMGKRGNSFVGISLLQFH